MAHTFIYEQVDAAKAKPADDGARKQVLLEGRSPIERLDTVYNELDPGAECSPPLLDRRQRVLLFIKGSGEVRAAGKGFAIERRAVFASYPTAPFTITAGDEGLQWIDFVISMTDDDMQELAGWEDKYPYFLSYYQSDLYDGKDGKPKKMFNRISIPPHLVPRVAMGAVDDTPPSYMKPHAHPPIDQFFFSFEENDFDLLLDDQVFPLKGNTLFYIPLGASHGFDAVEGQRVHYLWVDFLAKPEDMQRMVNGHPLLGRKG